MKTTTLLILTVVLCCSLTADKSQTIVSNWAFSHITVAPNKTIACKIIDDPGLDFLMLYLRDDNTFETIGACITSFGYGQYSFTENQINFQLDKDYTFDRQRDQCYGYTNCLTETKFAFNLFKNQFDYSIINDTILEIKYAKDTTLYFDRF